MDTNTSQLNEAQRSQLDGVVQKMTSNRENPSAIQFVVNDFKQKYATPIPPKEGFWSSIGTGIKNIGSDILGTSQNKSQSFIPSIIQSTLGSKGLAGVAQMPGRVISAIQSNNDSTKSFKQSQDYGDQAFQLFNQAKTQTDPVLKQKYIDAATNLHNLATKNLETGLGQQESQFTPGQALGTAGNAALTVATSGTGSIPKALGLSGKAAFGVRVAENAAIGGAFQTTSNLADKRPIGENVGVSSLIGAALPFAGVGFQKAKQAIFSKATPTAEMFINSLIKPLQKDFAYGKNPARGILNEGIVANSFDDLTTKVADKITQVGSGIGSIGQKLEQSGVTLNLTPALKPIDTAIANAAKSNNTTLFNSLNNVKVALMHDLQAGADTKGVPTIVQGEPKNLIGATYDGAKTLLSDISSHTRFTGNPSDDKALNMATKQAYGIARDIMNKTADSVDPVLGTQIRNLNERYADLLSAKSAIAHRDIVLKRQNILNLAQRFSIPVTILGGLLTGQWSTAGAVLLGELAVKAGGSTAAKTRIAQFISRLAPVERQGIFNSTPGLKNLYERMTGVSSAPDTAPKTKSLQAVDAVTNKLGQVKDKVMGVEKPVEIPVSSESVRNKIPITDKTPFLAPTPETPSTLGMGTYKLDSNPITGVVDVKNQKMLALPSPTTDFRTQVGSGKTISLPTSVVKSTLGLDTLEGASIKVTKVNPKTGDVYVKDMNTGKTAIIPSDRVSTKPTVKGTSVDLKTEFTNMLEKQLKGTGLEGSTDAYKDATFNNKTVTTSSLKPTSIDDPSQVKDWENKISNGERPTILTRTQGGKTVVADGSHKLQAYKNLGIKEVPTIDAKMSDTGKGEIYSPEMMAKFDKIKADKANKKK